MASDELVLVWGYRVPAEAPEVYLAVVGEDLGDALFDDLEGFGLQFGGDDGLGTGGWDGDFVAGGCCDGVFEAECVGKFEEAVAGWWDDFSCAALDICTVEDIVQSAGIGLTTTPIYQHRHLLIILHLVLRQLKMC